MNRLTDTLRDIQNGLRPIRHHADGSLNGPASTAIRKLTIAIAVAEEIDEAIRHGNRTADTWSTTDSLDRLIRRFREHQHGGVTMDGETVGDLITQLDVIRSEARALEHELSRFRWNARPDDSGRERQDLTVVGAEGNVVRLGLNRSDPSPKNGGGAA